MLSLDADHRNRYEHKQRTCISRIRSMPSACWCALRFTTRCSSSSLLSNPAHLNTRTLSLGSYFIIFFLLHVSVHTHTTYTLCACVMHFYFNLSKCQLKHSKVRLWTGRCTAVRSHWWCQNSRWSNLSRAWLRACDAPRTVVPMIVLLPPSVLICVSIVGKATWVTISRTCNHPTSHFLSSCASALVN